MVSFLIGLWLEYGLYVTNVMPEPQGTAAQSAVTKTCPICGQANPGSAEHCNCGYDFATGQVVRSPIAWFMVGSTKLIVMSVVTIGLYEIYWIYKQWDAWRTTTNRKINPVARAIFGFFSSYSLFKRVAESARSVGLHPQAAPGSLWVTFLLLSACAALPDPYWLITFFSAVPLVLVQRDATAVTLHHSPGADANTRIKGSNWWAVILGGLFFILAVIGAFLPEEPPT